MSAYLIEGVSGQPQVEILLNTEVIALPAMKSCGRLRLRNTRPGRVAGGKTSGLFFARRVPPNAMGDEIGILRDSGWLSASPARIEERRPHGPDNWTLDREPPLSDGDKPGPGVFAVGDVRHGSPIKRCA